MLADRVMTFLRLLRDGDPLTCRWYYWPTEEFCIDVAEQEVRLPAYINDGVVRDDYGAPDSWYGYHFHANNTPAYKADARTLNISLLAGSHNNYNYLQIETPNRILPSPEILTYPLFRGLLMAIVDAFEPEFAYASPINLSNRLNYNPRRYNRSSPMPPCWMIYLDPSLAARAAPKPPLVTETCPNGGLLMAATTKPFMTDNPAHLAGARLIGEVLDPLNRTVPFEVVGSSR
jgi:hypothetical protein